MLIEKSFTALKESMESLKMPPLNQEDSLSFTEYGHFSSNISFAAAKVMKKNPMEIALKIAESMKGEFMLSSSAVKPGFINVTFTDRALIDEMKEIASEINWGKKDINKGKVNLEFVSANPTGPLVLVNMRAGVAGNCLAKIMQYSGYDAVKENYVNDSGKQVHNLGASILFHIAKDKGEFPENGYKGSYIKDIAFEVQKNHPPLNWSEENINLCADEGKRIILESQKKSLERFHIVFDSWVYESFIRNEYIKKTEEYLREKKYIYVNENAVFLRTTDFGDDKDRVIYKSDGEMTYFLPDIAYHFYKAERGFDRIIDILGPDHHGYTSRIKASLQMLDKKSRFDIIIAQIVTLYRNNEKYEMSKRAGDFISMDELAEEIDPDVLKFLVLSRKLSQPFNFDIEKAKETTMDNPVYYVQYAYARLSSLMSNACINSFSDISYDYDSLGDDSLRSIAAKLLEFPYTVYSIAETYEIQKLPTYIVSLSSLIHSYYHDNRIITDDKKETNIKISVLFAARRILRTAFEMIGITVKERMEKNEV
ncbi:TPA: arginine--tRNA ligase [candidate division WOR-3 bacterium]|uniref:Arginine--tRNA ligase n=1 Tax=candidate division WOR-3 bacterium TaxID=2052148 RepID=A0A350HB87_UNCW3|nr:arginine--tRNA ligase [candidate division WOR-3 bacterium]